MGKRGSKHANVATLSGAIPNGVDFSSAPTSIPEGFALDMLNMYYPDQGTAPTTRPGTTLLTWDETDSDDPIDAMYLWEKNATDTYLIVAKGSKLYRLASGALAEIGSLTSGVVPCFCNFNQKLIIADKAAAGLRYWDGTTYSTVTGSPTYPTVCKTHGSNLLANSMGTGEFDVVYLSAAEAETVWSPSSGGSYITTEYGSGLWVSAVTSFNGEIVTFKRGEKGARQIFRVNATGTEESWSGKLFATGSTALTHATVCNIGTSDVMFADEDGVKMLGGSDKFGDYAIASTVGQRIKPQVSTPVKSLTQLAPWGGVMLLADGMETCYFFHPHNGAWCPMRFEFGTVTAVCADSDTVYFGDSKGRIWQSANIATDDYVDDDVEITSALFASYVHTPLQADSYGIILRRMNVLMRVLSAGSGTISVVGADLVTETQIAAWDSASMDGLIYGDDGPIYGDDELIFSTTENHVRSFARHRANSLSIKIEATGGRFAVNQIGYEVARVNS